MKILQNHKINSRTYTSFVPDELALLQSKEKNYLFDLSYMTTIDINGDKALEFLQGQLTCDVSVLSDIQMARGAQCNLKGRILSLLDIINLNGTKIILPDDMKESTQNSLIKTAMLSRVTIKSTANYKIYGFYLQNKKDLIPFSTFLPTDANALAQNNNYSYYHLNNGFYIFVIASEMADDCVKQFSDHDQLLGSLTWHTLQLMRKQIEIYPESRGLFLPHRLGLHETSYISFNKGCYKGQEIIARTHYRATIKHELRLFSIQSDEAPYSGQKIFKEAEDIEIGEIIDYSILNANHYLIAVSIMKGASPRVRFEGQDREINLETVTSGHLG